MAKKKTDHKFENKDAQKVNDPVTEPDNVPELPIGTPGETVMKRSADKFRNELKKVEEKVEEHVKKFEPQSAMVTIEKAVDKGDSVKTDSGFETEFKGTIDKSTAERLANRLNDLAKGEEVDLKELTDKVVSQVETLHREKARRYQQDRRVIQNLRSKDPKGIRTCGRCGFRVDITKMDVKKELCEICAS